MFILPETGTEQQPPVGMPDLLRVLTACEGVFSGTFILRRTSRTYIVTQINLVKFAHQK
ncbi:MAG: hypothetical protein LBJ59_05490 [Zoogloeaceae bacterium]|nr:hypothetical protein [Zoogloeaceae bacterium]